MATKRYFKKNTQFRPNDGYQSRNTQREVKKHSGCSVTKTESGDYIVSGWKVSKGQMISLYGRPYKGTKEVTSKEGKKWQNLFVTITNKTTMQVTNTSGMFDVLNKKLYIKSLNLIANPKGGRGGYFGKHISSDYR